MDTTMSSSAFLSALRDRTMRLSGELDAIGTPDGIVAYNPLAYAWAAHARYLDLFAGPRRIVIAGMNPGPWGMVQTGVPFGNVEHARVVLDIRDEPVWRDLVRQPRRTLDDRPVQGFSCQRDEVSGRRFWSGLAPLWARDMDDDQQDAEDAAHDQQRFRTALRRMLGECFVMNLCPLAFFDAVNGSGAAPNVTPDKLPQPWRDRLVGDGSPCATYFADMLRLFRPEVVVVMGAWVEKQVMRWAGSAVRVFRIPHPSPANPASNKGWAGLVQAALRDGGVVR